MSDPDPWDLDERFIYETGHTIGGETFHVRVGCHHLNTEPVRNVHTGIEVAVLCLDCDEQLPPRRDDYR